MRRRLPRALLGLYLLVVLLVGVAGVVLAVVTVALGGAADDFDFTGEWSLWEGTNGLILEVSDEDGVLVASLEAHNEDWRRDAEMTRADASQLVGLLGTLEGTAPPQDPWGVASAPEGSTLSIARLTDREVAVSFRIPDDESWSDVGAFERTGAGSAQHSAIQTVVIVLLMVLVVASIGLALTIPVVSRLDGQPAPGGSELLLRVVGVLAAAVVIVALLRSRTVLALGAYVVMLPIWFLHFLKWLPPELPSAGALLAYLFSARRRAEVDADLASQEQQAVRGAALEAVLDDVRRERSDA